MQEENEMELHAARNKGEGDTWENGTRPFFGPVSFTPGIFQAFIKKPSIFKVKFHRVTSRVYERKPLDRTRAFDQKRSIVRSPIADVPILCHRIVNMFHTF